MNDTDIYKMMESSNNEEDAEAIDSSCKCLLKRFDTVQIFVTRHHPKTSETISQVAGRGNWHVRYGQVVAWVKRCDFLEESQED